MEQITELEHDSEIDSFDVSTAEMDLDILMEQTTSQHSTEKKMSKDASTEMDMLMMDPQASQHSTSTVWKVFGSDMSRSALVYVLQMFILYICIIVSFVNLTLINEPKELWIAIIGVSLGCIIPSPKI